MAAAGVAAPGVSAPAAGQSTQARTAWLPTYMPFDHLFAKVESELINAICYAAWVFGLSSNLVKTPGTTSSCRAARYVTDADSVFDAKTASESLFMTSVAVLVTALGAINGAMRRHGRCFRLAGRCVSVLLAVTLLVLTAWDVSACLPDRKGPAAYCSGAPVADFLARSFEQSPEDWDTVSLAAKWWAGVDEDETCKSAAADVDVQLCQAAVPAGSRGICNSTDALQGVCVTVAKCFASYPVRYGTTARSVFMLLFGISFVLATLLELLREFPRTRAAVEPAFSRWPAGWHRLLRQVPLTLFAGCQLNVVSAMSLHNVLAGLLGEVEGVEGGSSLRVFRRARTLLAAYFTFQVAVFTAAAARGVRKYMRHAAQLSELPWEHFRTDSAAPQPAGLEGVLLRDLRQRSFLSAPPFCTAALVSLWLGASILALILVGVVVVAYAFFFVPSSRNTIFKHVVNPLLGSMGAYWLLTVGNTVYSRVIWGDENVSAKRPGWALINHGTGVVLSVAATPVFAITRLAKKSILAVVGLLSVTGADGTKDRAPLSDSLHGYYLAVLRCERSREEQAAGRLPPPNEPPDTSCRGTCHALCTMCFCTCCAGCALACVLFGVQLVFLFSSSSGLDLAD